jgi:hypothetical protein
MSLDRSEGLALVSWGEGPLALWRAGIQVINVWQRVWLDNVSRTQDLFNAWPTASEKALAPWSDLAGRWSERADALGLGANRPAQSRPQAAPSKAAAAVTLPKPVADESLSERKDLEAAIAAKQGRSAPKLGCLEGVEVVGGPVPSAPVVAEPQVPATTAEVAGSAPTAGSVTSMLAMQAKSLARAVRTPRQNPVEQPARKVAAKAASDAPAKAKVARTAAVAVPKTPVKAPAKKLAKPSSAKARQAG